MDLKRINEFFHHEEDYISSLADKIAVLLNNEKASYEEGCLAMLMLMYSVIGFVATSETKIDPDQLYDMSYVLAESILKSLDDLPTPHHLDFMALALAAAVSIFFATKPTSTTNEFYLS